MKLWDWFAAEVNRGRRDDVSLSYEISPEDRDPSCLAVNLDTETHVASAQIWDTGNVYLECLEVESETELVREHLEGLALQEIQITLRSFVNTVLSAKPEL